MSGDRRLRKALVMCVDQTFAPFAFILASQIDRLCPTRDFDICLVSDAQLVVPSAFDGLHLRLIGPVQDPAYLALENRELPRSTYLRLWIPHLLNQDYDRLVYLDADMFAEGGDWSALFEVDLQGHALAAVRDVQQWREPERQVVEFQATGRGSRPYFNAGLMVIDPAIFVAQDVRDRCLALGDAQPMLAVHHDQSLLNLVLDGAWAELSPVWNWQWPLKNPMFTDWAAPNLIHFIGHLKPWNDKRGLYPQRYRSAYSSFMSQHFSGAPVITVPETSLLRSVPRTLRMVVQFLARRAALLRYLDRFPDPLATARSDRRSQEGL